MPFTSYASVADVSRAHRIRFQREDFIAPLAAPLAACFQEELAFTRREIAFDRTEASVCENLVYPLIREVWKPYREALTLWGHEPLTYDDDLCGVPDYMVSRRSPLGPFVPDQPYLLVVEAKRDDFARGWGQCLAAMLAAQKLSGAPGGTFFGISTNGRGLEFGRLQVDSFVVDDRLFTLNELESLAAALNFVMASCRDQVGHLVVGV